MKPVDEPQQKIINFFFKRQENTGTKTNILSRNNQEFDVWKCEFCGKMRLWKWEFCEKGDFENVIFVENEILKLWILWKMRLRNCDFCEKGDFPACDFLD